MEKISENFPPILVYNQTWDYGDDEFGNVSIRGWGYNNSGSQTCLRIENFYPEFYAELPLRIDNKNIIWNQNLADKVIRTIKKLSKDKEEDFFGRIKSVVFVTKKKSQQMKVDENSLKAIKDSIEKHFFEEDPKNVPSETIEKVTKFIKQREFPCLHMKFRSFKSAKKHLYFLKKGIEIEDVGKINMEFHEDNDNKIPLLTKFFAVTKCQASGLISGDFQEVPEEDRVSNAEKEYIANYETLRPVFPNDPLLSKLPPIKERPKIMSFDFEVNSANKLVLPNPELITDCIFLSTIVFQRLGEPNSRKIYAILYGECEPIEMPGLSLIFVRNEKELIRKHLEIIVEENPDIIIGYNIFAFDNTYLDDRLSKIYKMSYGNLSRLRNKEDTEMKRMSWSSSAYSHVDINYQIMEGRISVDMMLYIKRDYKFSTYTLEAVSQAILGKGKLGVTPQFMFEAFGNWKEATEYLRAKTDLKFRKKIIREISEVISQIDMLINSKDELTSELGVLTDEYESLASEKYKNASEKKKALSDLEQRMSKITDKISNINSMTYSKKLHQIRKGVLENIDNFGDRWDEICNDRLEKGKQMLTKVVRYGIIDSIRVLEIFETTNTYYTLKSMSNVMCVPQMDLFTRGQQIRVISQFYQNVYNEGYILDKSTEEGEEYSGAFVFTPQSGVYEHALCFDFASLYPSIMRAYNICPSTFVRPEIHHLIPRWMTYNFEWTEEVDERFDEEDADGNIVSKIGKNKVKKHYNIRFMREEYVRGLIPSQLEELTKKRKAVNRELNLLKEAKEKGENVDPVKMITMDKEQNGLKVSSNSAYGSLGFIGGMLTCIPGAHLVTHIGKESILKVNEYLSKKHNAEVIYGDTDSTFVRLPQIKVLEDCEYWGEKLSKEISKELFKAPMSLEYEKAFLRVLLIKKKKYAGILIKKNKEGKFVAMTNPKDFLIRGIVLTRRDNCPLLKKVYRQILEGILFGKPYTYAQEIVDETIQRLYTGQIPLDDLVIVKTLNESYKSTTADMKVFADDLFKAGKPQSAGSRPQHVICKNKGKDPNKKEYKGNKMKLVTNVSEEVIIQKLLPEGYVANGTDEIVEKEENGIVRKYKIERKVESRIVFDDIYTKEREKGKLVIDYDYYLNNQLANPLDQLLEIGYREEAEKGKKFINRLKKRGNAQKINQKMNVLKSELKNKVTQKKKEIDKLKKEAIEKKEKKIEKLKDEASKREKKRLDKELEEYIEKKTEELDEQLEEYIEKKRWKVSVKLFKLNMKKVDAKKPIPIMASNDSKTKKTVLLGNIFKFMKLRQNIINSIPENTYKCRCSETTETKEITDNSGKTVTINVVKPKFCKEHRNPNKDIQLLEQRIEASRAA